MRVIANDEKGLPVIFDDVHIVEYSHNSGTILCLNTDFTCGMVIYIPNKVKINPENYKRFFDTLVSTGSIDIRNHQKYVGRIQDYPVTIDTDNAISIRTDTYDYIAVDASGGDPVSVNINKIPEIKMDN